MYIPNHFKNENIQEVKEFLKEHSFGIIITQKQKEGKLLASHIPLELAFDPKGNEVIYGHVSKANPQWKAFHEAEEVLLIFNGPHSYVSSSWYKEEEVPTWNYIAVHIYGNLKIINESELLYSLEQLMEKYERTSKNPVRIHELSDNTMRQIKGIVGFKVSIKEIQAAYKMSQNRSPEDRDNIVSHLTQRSHLLDEHTANEMIKRKTNTED